MSIALALVLALTAVKLLNAKMQQRVNTKRTLPRKAR